MSGELARASALLLLTAGLVLAVGCGDGDDDGPDRVQPLVADAEDPAWVDPDSGLYLFAPSAGSSREEGIYIASTSEGVLGPLYQGPHNYDYAASPDGARIGFSIPGIEGELRVVERADGSTVSAWRGGRWPSWLTEDQLAYRDHEGRLVAASPGTDGFTVISEQGVRAFGAGTGVAVAWVEDAPVAGLVLYHAPEPGGAPRIRLNSVGTDVAWNPRRTHVYATRLLEGEDIYSISIASPELEPSVLLPSALRPSVSTDGLHLFAEYLEGGVVAGVVHLDLATGQSQRIGGLARPAAGSGAVALVEDEGGISRLDLEP